MRDPFVGTWVLNTTKSQFDANHQPSAATMQFEMGDGGTYVMQAAGVNQRGESVTERPQTLVPDGRAYPVPDFPGLAAVTTRPDPRTLRAECRREDGSLAGEGRYIVSEDGESLTATTAGFDTQLRRFEQKTVWDRR